MLYAPRLAYSLSAQGDFPTVFARLHPRFHTPAAAIIFYAVSAWALASSGTFLTYPLAHAASESGRVQDSIRYRTGVLGVAIALALMTALKRRELLLMCITALIASANWLWARRHQFKLEAKASAVTAPLLLP
jgi:amino acid transporter